MTLPSGRDIYELANQLGGYIDERTPDDLMAFLQKQEKAAVEMAEAFVHLGRMFEQCASDQIASIRWQETKKEKDACRLRAEVYQDCANYVWQFTGPVKTDGEELPDPLEKR